MPTLPFGCLTSTQTWCGDGKTETQRRSLSTVIQCDFTPNAGNRKVFPFYLFISAESLPLRFWRQARGVKLTGMKFECSDIDNHVKRTQKLTWEAWRTDGRGGGGGWGRDGRGCRRYTRAVSTKPQHFSLPPSLLPRSLLSPRSQQFVLANGPTWLAARHQHAAWGLGPKMLLGSADNLCVHVFVHVYVFK